MVLRGLWACTTRSQQRKGFERGKLKYNVVLHALYTDYLVDFDIPVILFTSCNNYDARIFL